MGAMLDRIDLVNPDNYVERVPFEWFDELRHERPVSWHEEPGGNKGFWAVTRFDDLTAIATAWILGSLPLLPVLAQLRKEGLLAS